nr:hypothetical protein [Angustibacter aerolatus]
MGRFAGFGNQALHRRALAGDREEAAHLVRDQRGDPAGRDRRAALPRADARPGVQGRLGVPGERRQRHLRHPRRRRRAQRRAGRRPQRREGRHRLGPGADRQGSATSRPTTCAWRWRRPTASTPTATSPPRSSGRPGVRPSRRRR